MGGQRKRTNYNVFESEQQGYTTVKVNLFVQQRGDNDNGWQEVPVTKRIAERHIPELFERIEEELAR